MDVCSPKDGFVIKMLAQEGEVVQVGAPLLEMDSDWEQRMAERIRTREALRLIDARQYTGEQMALVIAVAQAALDSAEAQFKEAERKHHSDTRLLENGALTAEYKPSIEAKFAQATFDRERARVDMKQLKYFIDRQGEIQDLAKSLNERYAADIQKRIERLKIAAPTAGKVKLCAQQGSFAQLGSKLLEIH